MEKEKGEEEEEEKNLCHDSKRGHFRSGQADGSCRQTST